MGSNMNSEDFKSFLNAKDYRSFTPMHYASKAGRLSNIQLLLDNGGDVSAQGHRLKTPLHKARLPEVVNILCKNGAPPYSRILKKTHECDEHEYVNTIENIYMDVKAGPLDRNCICCLNLTSEDKECLLQGDISCNDDNSISVLTKFIERSSNSADALMDNLIFNNGFEKDSDNYKIIYDLEIFKKETLKDSEEVDDLNVHRRILELKSNSLLHPLSAMMIILKWKFVTPIFWIVAFQYALFVLSLSFMAIFEANFLKWFGDTLLCGSNSTKMVNISSFEGQSFRQIISCSSKAFFYGFLALYVFLMIQSVILIVRELSQVICNWKEYLRSNENLMEFVMLTMTVIYLVSLMICNTVISKHLAAWSVFLSWIEVILLIGRDPRAAIYVHMFTTVLRVLLRCLIIYSPALVAFSLSFHILMPDNEVFPDPGTSFLKIFTMMLGEMEYFPIFAPNSEYTEAHGYSAIGSTQLVFVLFMIAVGIIIVNLLVGLTIGELDELRKRARAIRLENVAVETILCEKIWNSKNPFMRWIFIPIAKLFGYLDISLFQYLNQHINQNLPNESNGKNFKVCVLPNEAKRKSWSSGIARNIGASSRQFTIYVYNEEENKQTIKVGEIPSSVIVRSQEIIDHVTEKQKKKKDVEENQIGRPSLVDRKTTHFSDSEYKANENVLLKRIERMENKMDQILTALPKFVD